VIDTFTSLNKEKCDKLLSVNESHNTYFRLVHPTCNVAVAF